MRCCCARASCANAVVGDGVVFFIVFLFIRASFEALYDGVNPSARFDNKPWTGLDLLWRAGVAGTALALQGLLLDIKGDWAEFSHTLGFPTWKALKSE